MVLRRGASFEDRNERESKRGSHHGQEHTPKENQYRPERHRRSIVDRPGSAEECRRRSHPSRSAAHSEPLTKDIVATLQSRIDSANAVSSSKATWQAAVQADRANHEKTRTYVAGLRQALLVAFAETGRRRAGTGSDSRRARRPSCRPTSGLVSPGRQGQGNPRARVRAMGKKRRPQIKARMARHDRPGASSSRRSTPIPTPPAAPAPARRYPRRPREALRRWHRQPRHCAGTRYPRRPCRTAPAVAGSCAGAGTPAPVQAATTTAIPVAPTVTPTLARDNRRDEEEVVVAGPASLPTPRMVRGSSEEAPSNRDSATTVNTEQPTTETTETHHENRRNQQKRNIRTIEMTHDKHLDEFDDLAKLACRGDDRAVGAIAIALGPTLLEAARSRSAGELRSGGGGMSFTTSSTCALLGTRASGAWRMAARAVRICGVVRRIAQRRRRDARSGLGLAHRYRGRGRN